MSVVENENEVIIPSEDELIEAPRGNSWRLSGGKIVRGRESTGVEERKNNRVYGLVKRLGIHKGTGKDDGRTFEQFEVEVQHPEEGMVSVHAGLLDQKGRLAPSVSAISLAESAIKLKPGDLIVISAYLGNAKEQDKRPTIATVDVVDPATKKMNRVPRDYDPNDKRTTDERWNALEPLVRAHPLFAERPAKDDETHFGLFCAECKEKGWPSPREAPEEWLGLMAAFFKTEKKSRLDEIEDDDWGTTRLTLKEKKDVPKALIPAAERLKSKPVEAEEEDAFA